MKKFILQSKKIDKGILNSEKKMYEFEVQNESSSVTALRPHLVEKKGFDKSMKTIKEGTFK